MAVLVGWHAIIGACRQVGRVVLRVLTRSLQPGASEVFAVLFTQAVNDHLCDAEVPNPLVGDERDVAGTANLAGWRRGGVAGSVGGAGH